ncbi:MAG: sulfate ABC transporter ATP-binding protein [Deltaproteobacteria bacterium]|nr:sulfate ABC transporter ATP-binding protein [Deltaproteobacteria bacterium]
MSIEIRDIRKSFGSFEALRGVSLDVATGELVALLGLSGSGKTTLLRIIAGLETPDAGCIRFHGEEATGSSVRSRGVGFVFQHYALFRHMTVAQNVGFGLRVRRIPRKERAERVSELLQLVGLAGFEDRMPSQLSGGQRQRVALARALAPRPRLLLLDEPFGAVDAKVREELRRWLRRLHDEVGLTSLFVTHDQEEALAVADRVLVMHQGRVEQAGTPQEILDSPATEFVARFLGEANVFDSTAQGGKAPVGALLVPAGPWADGTPLRLVIRAYDLKFWREEPGVATVERLTLLGDRVKVEARVDGAGPLFAQFPRRSSLLHGVEPGCRIQVEVTTARAYPRDRETRAEAACFEAVALSRETGFPSAA